MHDRANGLPRKHIPRTTVNKEPRTLGAPALMSATQLSSLCLGGYPVMAASRIGLGTPEPRACRVGRSGSWLGIVGPPLARRSTR
jgi:hypothetical protein